MVHPVTATNVDIKSLLQVGCEMTKERVVEERLPAFKLTGGDDAGSR